MAALGADVIAPEGFVEHGPFDVILELVGAPNLPDNLEALALWGRIMVIGIGAGAKAELNLGLPMQRRARILQLDAPPAAARGEGDDRAGDGALGAAAAGLGRRARPDRRDLSRSRKPVAAYERFAEGGKLGNIVLTMGG